MVNLRHQRQVLCRLPLFQLLHPRMARPATWTFPLRPVVGAVTSSCLDSQMQCHVGRSDFWKSSYVTKHRMTSSRDLVTNTFLASPVCDGGVGDEVVPSDSEYTSVAWHVECLELLFFGFQQCPGICTVQKDRDDKGIVQPQLCGQTQLFLSPNICKLAHYAWRKSDSPMYFRGCPTWRADCAAKICELVRDFDRLPLYVNWWWCWSIADVLNLGFLPWRV